MGKVVVKFGGTSLSGAEQISKVLEIIRSDTNRRYVIPSAPGKRNPEDKKITDLLILCHSLHQQGFPFHEAFSHIESRFKGIVQDLGLALDIETLLDEVRHIIAHGGSIDHVASRGEWLSGHVLAEALSFTFADAKDLIFFDADGNLDEDCTYSALEEFWKTHRTAVIPGFYGSMPNGDIKTFPRGGSDITGAIIARGFHADHYENWTDVPGLSMVDPSIVSGAKPIRLISYNELEELSDGGAQVFHQAAIFPARDAGIPINIRNTNDPEDPGTFVIETAFAEDRPHRITGVAGKRFTVITVGKRGMSPEVGFVWKILGILKDFNVSVQHFPGGNNTVSLAIQRSLLPKEKLTKILAAINRECAPSLLEVDDDIGVITVVGHNMINRPGMAATIFTGLAKEKINIRIISQGTSELTVIVGVKGDKMEDGIRAIYHAFITGS